MDTSNRHNREISSLLKTVKELVIIAAPRSGGLPSKCQQLILLVRDLLFHDSDVFVRVEAIEILTEAMQSIDSLDKESKKLCVSGIVSTLKYDPHHKARLAAVESLPSLPLLPKHIAQLCKIKIRDKDIKVRQSAWKILKEQNLPFQLEEDNDIGEIFVQGLADSSIDIKRSAEELLLQYIHESQETILQILTKLKIVEYASFYNEFLVNHSIPILEKRGTLL